MKASTTAQPDHLGGEASILLYLAQESVCSVCVCVRTCICVNIFARFAPLSPFISRYFIISVTCLLGLTNSFYSIWVEFCPICPPN